MDNSDEQLSLFGAEESIREETNQNVNPSIKPTLKKVYSDAVDLYLSEAFKAHWRWQKN